MFTVDEIYRAVEIVCIVIAMVFFVKMVFAERFSKKSQITKGRYWKELLLSIVSDCLLIGFVTIMIFFLYVHTSVYSQLAHQFFDNPIQVSLSFTIITYTFLHIYVVLIREMPRKIFRMVRDII